MNPQDFTASALRTESKPNPIRMHKDEQRLLHAALGMASESGEFVDILKRNLFYGEPIDRTHLKEELGDLMWYIAIASSALGSSLEDVMGMNAAKLKTRYPEQFTNREALNRNLFQERNSLEGGSS